MDIDIQPLRITAGWIVNWNQWYELDPKEGLEHYFDGNLMLLSNSGLGKIMDLEWYPLRDLDGCFNLRIVHFLEVFNPKTNEMDNLVDWDTPYLTYQTASRMEMVQKIESLMNQLPKTKDPRILENRGQVSEPSESYRLELLEKGPQDELIERILKNGNRLIQIGLLDYPDMGKTTLERIAAQTTFKKVKNKARQLLNSKKYR